MSMYVELTLVLKEYGEMNGPNPPVCLAAGSFWFTIHPEGGSAVYLNSGATLHVNEGYEWIIEALRELNVPVSRAPEEDEDDDFVIEGTPDDL
jgi:hypothetical protein